MPPEARPARPGLNTRPTARLMPVNAPILSLIL
jgi:hypothetical protein